MKDERDTHFLGAAQILMSRLNTEGFDEDGYRSGETTQKIIAQFAYDVALHTVTECHKWDMSYMEVPGLMAEIPDLTSWPISPGTS